MARVGNTRRAEKTEEDGDYFDVWGKRSMIYLLK